MDLTVHIPSSRDRMGISKQELVAMLEEDELKDAILGKAVDIFFFSNLLYNLKLTFLGRDLNWSFLFEVQFMVNVFYDVCGFISGRGGAVPYPHFSR